MSEKLKRLTGKNPNDFEPAAYSLINEPDVELFQELVSKESFLFDFVKQKISERMAKACNSSNYMNLLQFLKYYSPSYEDFIVGTLVKYADENLTDKMLDLFKKGNEDEKTYCAKFFSYIQDSLALEFLRADAYSNNPALSANCAYALSAFGDKTSYNKAISKLQSSDEFEVLDGVRFLVSYGNKKATQEILKVMKKSPMAENIAAELPYLEPMPELLKDNFEDGLYVLNNIISGLGEISSLSQVFDFQLYEVIQTLKEDERAAAVLLNAYDKFNTLTENNEYLYDETKDVKQEIFDIKELLASIDLSRLKSLTDKELTESSPFVFTALEFTFNSEKVRTLLNSKNQTLLLKTLEILKKLNNLTPEDKNKALKNITNENIKNVAAAI